MEVKDPIENELDLLFEKDSKDKNLIEVSLSAKLEVEEETNIKIRVVNKKLLDELNAIEVKLEDIRPFIRSLNFEPIDRKGSINPFREFTQKVIKFFLY